MRSKIIEAMGVIALNSTAIGRNIPVPAISTARGEFKIEKSYGCLYLTDPNGNVAYSYDPEHDYDNMSAERLIAEIESHIK